MVKQERIRRILDPTTAFTKNPDGTPHRRYVGGFYINSHADLPTPGLKHPMPSTIGSESQFRQRDEADLDSRGARMYNHMRPDQPEFNLANAIYELKDLPGAYKHALETLQHAVKDAFGKKYPGRGNSMSRTAEWHLAIEFGWKPLFNDIRNFVKTQMSVQGRLNQLIRDEGKRVRHKWKDHSADEDEFFIKNGDHASPYYVGALPALTLDAYGTGKATYQTSFKYQQRIWSVGVFRYYLPPGPRDVEWHARMIGRLEGLYVTPSMVYKAIPWSWLVDWFSNLGDYIEMTTESPVVDRLICEGAWAMKTRLWEKTTSFTQNVRSSTFGSTSTSGFLQDRFVIKIRRPSTSFGFGLKSGDLSPWQVGILGALGFSKFPNVARR